MRGTGSRTRILEITLDIAFWELGGQFHELAPVGCTPLLTILPIMIPEDEAGSRGERMAFVMLMTAAISLLDMQVP